MALQPRAPAAATESSEAKLASSVAARDLKVKVLLTYGGSTASGSTSGSGTRTSSENTYTSSRGSGLSSELGLQLLCIDDDDEENPKRLERTKHLAKEFCHGDGDTAALQTWLSEMGVDWVLDLADDPSAGTSWLRAQAQCDNLAERWIRALTEITVSTHPEYITEITNVPDRIQLLRFVEAVVLKILPFVDALLAAADLDVSIWARALPEKLQALLNVRDALSKASGVIQLGFKWDSLEDELEAQQSKLLNLLSEKEHRLEEAIWNTMEEVRTGRILNNDDEWGIQTSQGSPDVCKITQSLVTYIKSLWNNFWRLYHIVGAAAELGSYVPNHDTITVIYKTDPFTSLTLEMVFSLEVKLAKISESFPDDSLRSLFLINNTHFMRQQLDQFPLRTSLVYHNVVRNFLTPKIEEYIQKYLQASWAPVMSCLNNNTTHCFGKNSALPKFDLEFQKTYNAQKLWKVPDPELRTRLREAIVEQVVPGLTKYLEDNNVTSPAVTPQEQEEMLLELFEG